MKYKMRRHPTAPWWYLGQDARGVWEQPEGGDRRYLTLTQNLEAFIAIHRGWEVVRLTSCPRRVSV